MPKEIRDGGVIKPGELVKIFIEPEKENIILKRYQGGIFCDTVEVEIRSKGKGICEDCLAEMKAEIKKMSCKKQIKENY